jgi:hypothetical protein
MIFRKRKQKGHENKEGLLGIRKGKRRRGRNMKEGNGDGVIKVC